MQKKPASLQVKRKNILPHKEESTRRVYSLIMYVPFSLILLQNFTNHFKFYQPFFVNDLSISMLKTLKIKIMSNVH